MNKCRVKCNLDGLQGSKMYEVWLLPLGGALAFDEVDESAPREKRPIKTQLCRGQSWRAMTQRLHWRTNRCAAVPTQHPSGIHLLPSQPQLRFAEIRGVLQDCAAALRGLHGLLIDDWCRKHGFYVVAFVMIYQRKSQSEQTHFAGHHLQKEISHPSDKAVVSVNKHSDSFFFFFLPINFFYYSVTYSYRLYRL